MKWEGGPRRALRCSLQGRAAVVFEGCEYKCVQLSSVAQCANGNSPIFCGPYTSEDTRVENRHPAFLFQEKGEGEEGGEGGGGGGGC